LLRYRYGGGFLAWKATPSISSARAPDSNADAAPTAEAAAQFAPVRPAGPDAKLDSEIYKALEAAGTRIYNAPTLPTMSTGATDMAQLRAKGVQCFGIGPAVDFEDAPKGFGAHSDQERLLESELHRFVQFNWDVVTNLARAK
jgi:acetylornithine deacetylase/succinyl-diaminopimelate desuccinylase-like protein